MLFFGEDPDAYPSGSHVLQLSTQWIESLTDERLAYYSAEEAPPHKATHGQSAAAGKAKAKAPTRKVTTSQPPPAPKL